jgi:multiple sugar transport system ATP-binding protein
VATLDLDNVVKRFDQTTILHGISLDVRDGEFVVFVGPSGCGKSTLLRVIAGLESPTGGDIRIDGQVVNQVSAAHRGCAMVFQSYALYPHMTVFDNMAFGLENLGEAKASITTKVNAAASFAASGRTAAAQTDAALGRSAPAGGHWPSHCAQPQAVFV